VPKAVIRAINGFLIFGTFTLTKSTLHTTRIYSQHVVFVYLDTLMHHANKTLLFQ